MMNTSRIVSAEKSKKFINFDHNNLIVDINNAAPTKSTTISGMFIPIKYKHPTGITSFKLQTPEVFCKIQDCDSNDPGKNYKLSLMVDGDSSRSDPSFLSEDLKLQTETVEILQQFKKVCVAQLEEKKQLFLEKNKAKKINQETWNYMISSFEVVHGHTKTDNTLTRTNYYINPKIYNNKYFTTTFFYKNDENKNEKMSYENFIKTFLNKNLYCIAIISIDSLFFQASSNKLFAQVKLNSIVISRLQESTNEEIVLPDRFKNLEIKKSEDDTNEEDEDNIETDTSSNPE